jgi:hypothetical protein
MANPTTPTAEETTPPVAGARSKPFTSAEYLESLRDGREVYIYGERVKDVTTHPAFRNTTRMLARLYDALHDERKSILCTPTETGNGGYTHKFFKAPRNVEEMVGSRDAIAEWAKVTYGWMGRSPDYKAAFLATLGANAEFYAPYDENARRWYKSSEHVFAPNQDPFLLSRMQAASVEFDTIDKKVRAGYISKDDGARELGYASAYKPQIAPATQKGSGPEPAA